MSGRPRNHLGTSTFTSCSPMTRLISQTRKKPDEVFFRLASPDDDFTDALRRYAGAVALEGESTGQHRTVYAEKRQRYLQVMVQWLRAHMGDAVTATYQGETLPLASWLPLSPGPRKSVKDQIDTIAGGVFVGYFEERYPGYPSFGAQVTRGNLPQTVRNALRQVVTGRFRCARRKGSCVSGAHRYPGESRRKGPVRSGDSHLR